MTLVLRRALLSAAVAAIVAIVAIGAARATAPATADAPAAPPAPLSALPGQTVGDDAHAVDLDAILAADQASPSAAPRAGAVGRGELRRLAAWRRLVHATVVVDLKKGGLTTVQVDHGTISAVTAATLTISETGGGSISIAIGDETRVRRDGSKAAPADLKTGDEIFVLSKVGTAGTEAYLVVVPRA